MLIIGAQINTSEHEEIVDLIEKKDKKSLLDIVKHQINLGAEMIDINAGERIKSEVEDIGWLLETIQNEYEVPISIDTPNQEVFKKCLKLHNDEYGKPLVNSVTGEEERLNNILPLVKKYDAKVVGLLMGNEGIPDKPDERIKIADKILKRTRELGIKDENVYLDPLVLPVSVNTKNPMTTIQTVRLIKEKYPKTKTICGLDNISFGLPERPLVSATFIAMMAAAGLDSLLVELSNVTYSTIRTVEMLRDEDDMCMNYIKNYKKDKLDIYKEEMKEVL
ncbi:MAG: dihydropteroate synthase [Halanaerobiales bacterium]|nr:dihydropteroate synthase [Halanaerobiales bacterium]